MVWWIAGGAGLLWLGLALVVVADMFRKNAALGFLGLVLLPIVPFIWVLKGYSGRRWRVAPALYLSAALSWVALTLGWSSAADALAPFLLAAQTQAGLQCELTATGSGGGHSYYRVLCSSDKVAQIRFVSSDDMAQQYNTQLVVPLVAIYRNTLPGPDAPHLIVGIASPAGMVSCHRLDATGVQKVWVTGTDDPCE